MIKWTPTKTAPSRRSRDETPSGTRPGTWIAGITLIMSLAAAPCAGVEISRVAICAGGDVLKLRGDIEAGDYVKFRSYFDGERPIAGLELDSPGGSLYEGFRIATMTRERRLSTFVAKECDSACAFIFLLGSKRYVAREAKIGVHAVGNDYGGEDTGTIRDTIHFARLYAKLGIPASTIGKMVTTPPGKITFLDPSDLSDMKVVMRDPFARKAGEGDQDCNANPERETAAAAGSGRMARSKTAHYPDSRRGKRAVFARPTDARAP
jgi:hypothetical protein